MRHASTVDEPCHMVSASALEPATLAWLDAALAPDGALGLQGYYVDYSLSPQDLQVWR